MKANKPCKKCGGKLEFTGYTLSITNKYQFRCVDCKNWELISFNEVVYTKGMQITVKGRLVKYKNEEMI